MTIEINNRSGELAPSDKCASLLEYAFTQVNLHPDCDINLTFINDEEMAELHMKWMSLEGSTDVMSFPMDMPEDSQDIVTLGDIVISPLFARSNADKAGHTSEHEIFILTAHGLLHILGYDHEELADEKVMFELQEKIVKDWESAQ